MKRQQLEHLLRASGAIIGETQFFVIGSQSVLGKYPNAPQELLWSMEVDLFAKNHPEKTDNLNVIGELSPFHDSHGYYADPVDEKTATLPKGWKGRLINVKSVDTGGVTGLCLDPHDLFVSKVAAGREKDIEFVKVMIEHDMVQKERVLQLAATVANPKDDLGKSERIIARITGLYGQVKHVEPTHLNERTGRYTGEILSMSDTIVQQDAGRGKVIYHDAKKLDKLPWLGQVHTIIYKDGVGQVSDPPTKAKDKALGR
ncbi:DUF6036 family nucleotidyltransferase [Herbaspirillum huttiense]|uniref:KfrB domain-containing protein n=1 Tax=Herbaspirillum huttiense TaxID=863372 RepID=UPI003830B5C9